MNKKLFLVLIFSLVFFIGFTQAFASLTFSNSAITGTTTSTIDLGSSNTLSLQTLNNGPISTGNGLFTVGGNLNVVGSVSCGSGCASGPWTRASSNTYLSNIGDNVGIGTTTPLTKLNIVDTTSTSPRGILSSQISSDVSGARVGFSKARGALGSETTILTGDTLGRLMFRGYDGSNYLEMSSIEVGASGTVAATRVPTFLALSTATDATPSALTERMRIDNAGSIGMGTTSPAINLDIRSSAVGTRAMAGVSNSDNSFFLSLYSGDSGVTHNPAIIVPTNKILRIGAGDYSASVSFIEHMRIDDLTNTIGIGTTAPTGKLTIAGNNLSTSLGTAGTQFQLAAATYTNTSTTAGSTVASAVSNSFGQPTFAANCGSTCSSNITYSDASTLYIANAPLAGTNVTITRGHALQVAAGDAVFAGNLGIGTTAPGAKFDVKDGHIASSQTTIPTTSVTGTGYVAGSLGSGSTDTKGGVTATVGANAGTVVVTFNSAYTTAPYCTVTPATATSQVDVVKMFATSSTSALTLNFVASPTGGSETFNYICLQ